MIYKANDTTIFLKTNSIGSIYLEDNTLSDKIASDSTLSRKEKWLRLMFLSFHDSEIYSYDSIKEIKFDLRYKSPLLLSNVIGAASFTGILYIFSKNTDSKEALSFSNMIPAIPVAAGFCLSQKLSFKKIQTKKFNLKKNIVEYDVINLHD